MSVKKFFQEKVMDFKFRKAGEGHKLNKEKPPPSLPKSQPTPRQAPSTSSQAAGQAALARFEQKEHRPKPTPSAATSSGSGGGATGGKRLCAQPVASPHSTEPRPLAEPTVEYVDVASQSVLVHLVCPICGHSVPHASLHTHYHDCLQEEYLKEPLTASAHMIHNLCQDGEARKMCIDTLCKYFDNILGHPGEEKYTKIPCENKTFKEKVQCVMGATLFLEATGFQQKLLPHKDSEQQFYVLPMDKATNTSDLEAQKELLTSAKPLTAKVDRNLQVFRPSSRATHFDLPRDFFNLTLEEIKKDQKQRSEIAERESVLRTKAMRERDNLKMTLRHYRFTLLRIRMPDGLILQGVFRPMEKMSEVRAFVSSALAHQAHAFTLSAMGKVISEEGATLASAELVPSAMLNFSWDSTMGPTPEPPFLTPELLARVQEM